jgi:hypothetical protein
MSARTIRIGHGYNYNASGTVSRLLTLPDDVLRAITAFVPPSGLLELVQCSRRLQYVLERHLLCRLDNLFQLAVARPGRNFQSMRAMQLSSAGSCRLSISKDDLHRLVEALFVDSGASDTPTTIYYNFVEAGAGYGGLSIFSRHQRVQGRATFRAPMIKGPTLNLRRANACIPCFVTCPDIDLPRFVAWIQRRYEQLLATEVLEEYGRDRC